MAIFLFDLNFSLDKLLFSSIYFKHNNKMVLELMVEYKWCGFIMHRIMMQFNDIIQSFFYNLNKEDKELLTSKLDDLSLEIKHLFDYLEEYKEEVNTSVIKIEVEVNESKKSTNWIQFTNPTIKLNKIFKNFMMNSVITTRKLVKLLSIIYNVNEKNIAWKKFASFFESTFWKDSQEHVHAINIAETLNEIYEIRAMIEHDKPNLHKLELSGSEIILPSFSIKTKDVIMNNKEIWEYMIECFEHLFLISENMIAVALNHTAPEKVLLYELSDEQKKESRFKDFSYWCHVNLTNPT